MIETSDLLRILPHRVSALYVDRVTDIWAGGASGYKNVTATEPQFRGHFVDKPVMPGVLTLEALLQMIWVAFRCQGLTEAVVPAGWTPNLCTVELTDIERLRFRHVVRPGDRLDLQVEEKGEAVGEVHTMTAIAKVDGKVACEATVKVIVQSQKDQAK